MQTCEGTIVKVETASNVFEKVTIKGKSDFGQWREKVADISFFAPTGTHLCGSKVTITWEILQ